MSTPGKGRVSAGKIRVCGKSRRTCAARSDVLLSFAARPFQLFSSVSATPPLNGVVQLNVVLNRYLSLVASSKPTAQLLTMFSRKWFSPAEKTPSLNPEMTLRRALTLCACVIQGCCRDVRCRSLATGVACTCRENSAARSRASID